MSIKTTERGEYQENIRITIDVTPIINELIEQIETSIETACEKSGYQLQNMETTSEHAELESNITVTGSYQQLTLSGTPEEPPETEMDHEPGLFDLTERRFINCLPDTIRNSIKVRIRYESPDYKPTE